MKKPSGVQTDGSTQNLVDVAAVDQLARIVSKYDLSEIEISLGDLQVRLARERAPAMQANLTAIRTKPCRGQFGARLARRSDCIGACGRPGRRREVTDGRNRLFAGQSRSQAVR